MRKLKLKLKQLRNNKRNQSLIQTGLVIGIALLLNILGNYFFSSFDLTEEKRFTLTKPTLNLLDSLNDVVYVEILLEGDFPAGFKRLQRSVREMLDDFRSRSGYMEYEFANPNEGSVKAINKRREELAKDGIMPTNLRLKDVEGTSEILIYPWAKVYYKGRMVAVDLLDEQGAGGQEEKLNTSISLLEFKFANAIQKLKQGAKEILAFTEGHGELNELERKDLVRSLRSYYEVGTFNLDSATYIPKEVKILIIAKPRAPFSERDKFLIDQYAMNGGKILWLIDRLNVSLDSMRRTGSYVPFDYPLNIEDLLFKYGIRINADMVLDLQCSPIPQVVDPTGKIELFKWYYHPIILPDSKHPIVRNLDGINLFFPSTIDTVRTKTPVKKTILLRSSLHSRLQFNTTRLNFEILRYKPDPSKFKKSHLPVAVLLEGEFPSLYENRVTESMKEGLHQLGQEFKTRSLPTKMLVVADGDVAKNTVLDAKNGKILPLGYNRFSRYQFANKDFLLNAVEYLRDENGIIEARNREVKLRLLDTVRAQGEKGKWQLINILLPLLFLLLFGIVFNWLRKKKYAN